MDLAAVKAGDLDTGKHDWRSGRKRSHLGADASDDLQNDPAYEPEDPGLKGIKGG